MGEMALRMSRGAAFALGVIVILAAAGCQTGHIHCAQVSADGQVLVFFGCGDDTICVATTAGIRRIKADGNYYLDPGGRWLLVFDFTDWRTLYCGGDHLTLIRLTDHHRYETRVPLALMSDVTVPEDGCTSAPAKRDGTDEPTDAEDRVRFFFSDEPGIMIGPIPAGNRYCRWRASDQGPGEWSCLPEQEAMKDIPAGIAVLVVPTADEVREPPPCVVEIPSDGWIALRTIWVLPDGSTMELVRKNDAPLRVLYACAMTIVAPIVGPFVDYGTGSIIHQISCSIDVPIFAIMVAWNHALEDLAVNQSQLKEARAMLQARIEDRRAKNGGETTAD